MCILLIRIKCIRSEHINVWCCLSSWIYLYITLSDVRIASVWNRPAWVTQHCVMEEAYRSLFVFYRDITKTRTRITLVIVDDSKAARMSLDKFIVCTYPYTGDFPIQSKKFHEVINKEIVRRLEISAMAAEFKSKREFESAVDAFRHVEKINFGWTTAEQTFKVFHLGSEFVHRPRLFLRQK